MYDSSRTSIPISVPTSIPRDDDAYADDFDDDFVPKTSPSFKPKLLTTTNDSSTRLRRNEQPGPGNASNSVFSGGFISAEESRLPWKAAAEPTSNAPPVSLRVKGVSDGSLGEMKSNSRNGKKSASKRAEAPMASFIHQGSATSLSRKPKPVKKKKQRHTVVTYGNLDEVTKLLSEVDSARMEITRLREENKNLKIDNRRQGKALKQSDANQNDVPKLVQSLTDEVRRAKLQAKQYHDKLIEVEKASHHHIEEALRLQERVHKLTRLLQQKGFEDAEKVEKTMKQYKCRVEALEKEKEESDRLLNFYKATKSLDYRAAAAYKSKLAEELDSVKVENARVLARLAEKEKALTSASIYTRHSPLIKPLNKSVMSETSDGGLAFFGGASPSNAARKHSRAGTDVRRSPTAKKKALNMETTPVEGPSHNKDKSPLIPDNTTSHVKVKGLLSSDNAMPVTNSVVKDEASVKSSPSAKPNSSLGLSEYQAPIPVSLRHASQPSSFLKPALFASLETKDDTLPEPATVRAPSSSSSPVTDSAKNKLEHDNIVNSHEAAPRFSNFFKPIAIAATNKPTPMSIAPIAKAIPPVGASTSSFRNSFEEEVEDVPEDFV
ncbi:hypothetical protein SeMB42_g04831 [Synchytrium endobioticum]|uniref:Lebercilin domain-containing protein n=1 Tax=Synchytrium endobioticum TaxID=286115 RepID=A0A507DGX6_9FUNG|nr:hypothetical protein SeMB42_g04831 [Synchytrium endobioticum]TPX50863.1 hypothetical protein SeLEV6574_g00659 [Synchytrium endobioticum]